MESKKIHATKTRLASNMNKIIDSAIENKNFEKLIEQKVDSVKVVTGVIKKYYPYLDKAMVKIDQDGKSMLCKILHRYGGDMIDFYSPLADRCELDEKLKEPCIIPKFQQNVCVLKIHDKDSNENLILGYYQNKEITGFNPAKPGNIKLMSILEDNLYWIKFGKDGFDYRLSSKPTMKVGRTEEDLEEVTPMTSEDVYTKSELDLIIKGYEERIKYLEEQVKNLVGEDVIEEDNSQLDNSP